MSPSDVQRLLASAGYYAGAIDGDIGPRSLAAIEAILAAHAGECSSDPSKWSASRRLVGAGQLVLMQAGDAPGPIDGYAGNQTIGALVEWNHRQVYGSDLVLDMAPTGPAVASGFPKQSGCDAYYGKPGPAVERQLVMVELPFEMRLGLDRHAGTYNHRRMRGGSAWSMHAYGCAWDFHAAPNGLTTRCPQALFCGREYRAFFDIWEAHGWISLGRAIGRDWMHVQAARL